MDCSEVRTHRPCAASSNCESVCVDLESTFAWAMLSDTIVHIVLEECEQILDVSENIVRGRGRYEPVVRRDEDDAGGDNPAYSPRMRHVSARLATTGVPKRDLVGIRTVQPLGEPALPVSNGQSSSMEVHYSW